LLNKILNEFYTLVHLLTFLVNNGFNLGRIFVINLITICTFFLNVLPLYFNCVVSSVFLHSGAYLTIDCKDKPACQCFELNGSVISIYI
jgi:hypothetical protein